MKQRIITGSIGGLLFVVLLVLGDIWFGLMISTLAFLAYYEIARMSSIHVHRFPFLLGAIFLALILYHAWFALPFFSLTEMPIDLHIILIAFMLSSLIAVVLSKNAFTIEQAGLLLIAVFYLGIGFSSMMEIRFMDGLYTISFILFVVWSTDTGAYFLGKRFGTNKLWPSISPNKTIEGFLGGIGVSVLIAITFQLVTGYFDQWVWVFVAAVVISIAGQCGDLIESAIKRYYDVKDSGSILPGHGGVFDRFDSLLFVFVLLHILPVL